MKLSIKAMLEIEQGLKSLNGRMRDVTERGEVRVIFDPAKLSSPTLSRVAFNLRKIREHLEVAREAAKGIDEQFSAACERDPQPDETTIAVDANAVKDWNARLIARVKNKNAEIKMLDETVEEVEMRPIKFDDLQTDKNEFITAAIIDALWPILTDLPA